MTMSEKEKIVKELNEILQVRDIHWNLLPDADFMRLVEAFRKLKADVDEIFRLINEVPTIIPDKGEWRHYCT